MLNIRKVSLTSNMLVLRASEQPIYYLTFYHAASKRNVKISGLMSICRAYHILRQLDEYGVYHEEISKVSAEDAVKRISQCQS